MGEQPLKPESLHSEVPIEERELSPEIIEMVMEKVEDINNPGIAFHVLGAAEKWFGEKKTVTETETINHVLRDGILGQTVERIRTRQRNKGQLPISQRGAYVEDAKKGELPRVWFDIIGRGPNVIENAFWIRRGEISVAVIFDLSKFVDGIGKEEEYKQRLKELEESGSTNPTRDCISQRERVGTFFPSDGSGPSYPVDWNEEGLSVGTEDFGHVLLGRVSPRHFRGIVLRVRRSKELNTPTENQEMIEAELKKIIASQLKIYQRKLEMLLPIYDTRGNLLWPKELSYKEIYKAEEEK